MDNYDRWLTSEPKEFRDEDIPAYEEYDYVVDASLGSRNDGPATECSAGAIHPDTDLEPQR